MSERITLRSVAAETGVSVATVSMALRNSPRLPEATRERIRKVAREMGYLSDPMLSALAAHRWNRGPSATGSTVAILADGMVEGKAGMAERAAAKGYQLMEFQIGDYPDPRRLADILYHRGILGVIVAQIFKPGFCEAFDWSRFIAVACSEGYERPPVHLVMPNHFKSVQDCWDRAWSKGHRRIGMALFDMPQAIDYHERCAAYLERQRQVPESARVPVFVAKPDARNDARVRDIGGWVRAWKLDAVLGFNIAFYWLLRAGGWSIPSDIAFFDLWITVLSSPEPGMYLPADEVGRRAVEYLDTLIRSGARGIPDRRTTLSVDFIWRDPRSAQARRRTPPNANRTRTIG